MKRLMRKATPSTLFLIGLVFTALPPSVTAAGEAPPDDLVLISSGTFEMGSPSAEVGRSPDEVLHKVTLSRPFFLGKTEVTWSQWSEVRTWALQNGYQDLSEGHNGFNGGSEESHPVTWISWWEAIQWCNARSEKEGRTPVYYAKADFAAESVVRNGMPTVFVNWNANGYRLPSEAEWEYAARAGTTSSVPNGSVKEGRTGCHPDPAADAAGWHCSNSEQNTHPGGQKDANAFGVSDMSGNVWEWCWDWYGAYPANETRDPTGKAEGIQRTLRGGSWMDSPFKVRAAYRHALAPATVFYNLGFRVAITAPK